MAADGSTSLHRIVYTSQATQEFNPDDLEELVTRAQAFNESASITGFLLYADGVFIQVLEGQRQPLYDLYARIRADSRHHCVATLIDSALDQRDFSSWSLGLEATSLTGDRVLSPVHGENPPWLLDSEKGADLLRVLQFLDGSKA